MKFLIAVAFTLLVFKSDAQRADTVSVIGVGDIMMGTNFPDDTYLPPHSGNQLLKPVEAILKDANITFGNLEGVILNEGGEAKKCKNPDVCYLFRTPEHYLENLVNAGFDLLSTANNHVNDFGLEGRKATVAALDSFKIPFAGFITKPTTVVEKDSIRYGLASFSPNKGSTSMFNLPKVKQLISHLDSTTDVVIVSIHTGSEGRDYQHVTREDEVFLGNNRGNIYEFARIAVDAGADIVFGHGPHVTRAVDLYRGRFIAYSLGNFCTYRRFNLAGPNGYAPIIKVHTRRNGEFLWADVFSIKQSPPGGPRIDDQHNAFDLLRNLTEEDIPEAELSFINHQIVPKTVK